MARSVQKSDVAFWRFYFISAYMLGNTAGFSLGNFAFSDSVQQRCLAVVHMPHYRNDRRPLNQFRRVFLFLLKLYFSVKRHMLDIVAELVGEYCRGIQIQPLIDSREASHSEQFFKNVAGLKIHF